MNEGIKINANSVPELTSLKWNIFKNFNLFLQNVTWIFSSPPLESKMILYQV